MNIPVFVFNWILNWIIFRPSFNEKMNFQNGSARAIHTGVFEHLYFNKVWLYWVWFFNSKEGRFYCKIEMKIKWHKIKSKVIHVLNHFSLLPSTQVLWKGIGNMFLLCKIWSCKFGSFSSTQAPHQQFSKEETSTQQSYYYVDFVRLLSIHISIFACLSCRIGRKLHSSFYFFHFVFSFSVNKLTRFLNT